MNLFCEYITSYAGMCGKWTPNGGLYKRHQGKKPLVRKDRQRNFRGQSSFWKNEIQGFQNQVE